MAQPTLDPYVVDVLMPDLVGHDRSPAAFIVYVYLAHAAGPRGRVQVSYATMAADTGLSKTCVQRAVAHLRRRKLVVATKDTPTSVPDYRVARPWVGRLPA
ncbi:MAG TPA: helix-turn-helix domain-containing protein [Casimicrobiaceae bacterium]|nr:helix-turn-helix domain-containing protein [Casimicrobiaceae bacterium]